MNTTPRAIKHIASLILNLFFGFISTLCAQEESQIGQLLRKLDSVTRIEDKTQIISELTWEYTITENDSALIYGQQLKEMAIKENYPLGEAISEEILGLYNELVLGNYETASSHYFAGIDICEKNNLEYKANLYKSLGAMFHTSDNYQKAIKYFTIAHDLAMEYNDSLLVKKCLINLGSSNSSLKNFQVAASYMEKSLDYPIAPYYDYVTYANLGHLYIKQGLYEKALPILLKSVEQSPENYDSEINLYFLLYLKSLTKDTVGMQPFINRAKKAVNEVGIRDKSLLLRNLADYYKSAGNYKEALEYRDRYVEVYEEIIDKQKNDVIHELETKYDTQQKDLEISVQRLEIQKKENQKVLLTGGLMVLGALLLGSILFFRKRLEYHRTISKQADELNSRRIKELQQENKLLALNSMIEGQELERMRIAKDLHDSLGGLLSSVKAHFSTIQEQIEQLQKLNIAEKTNNLIDEACIAVRRISHNMIPHALSLSGLPEVLEDLAEGLRNEGYGVDLDVRNFPAHLEKTKQAVLYRLVQEVLTNIRKHAKAQNIIIQIFGNNDGLAIHIEDDGNGFDFDKAMTKGGLGLKSINSRVAFLNGTIDWDVKEGQGTILAINIPKLT